MKAVPLQDGELRVYPMEQPYDLSDMYVLDVLGATASIRKDEDDQLKIIVEARGQFTVGVNDAENTYGDEA